MVRLTTFLRPPCPRRGRGAFTLLELLIVILIIMILVAILMPSFNKAKEHAYLARSRDRVGELSDAAYAWSRDNNGVFPGQANVALLQNNWGALANSTGSQILAQCLFGDSTGSLVTPQARYARLEAGDLVTVAGAANSIWDRFPSGITQPVAYFPSVPGGTAIPWATQTVFVKEHNSAYYYQTKMKDATDASSTTKTLWTRGNGASLVSGYFNDYINDTQTNNAARSSFILLAPGIDRVFGTSDDVMNF